MSSTVWHLPTWTLTFELSTVVHTVHTKLSLRLNTAIVYSVVGLHFPSQCGLCETFLRNSEIQCLNKKNSTASILSPTRVELKKKEAVNCELVFFIFFIMSWTQLTPFPGMWHENYVVLPPTQINNSFIHQNLIYKAQFKFKIKTL